MLRILAPAANAVDMEPIMAAIADAKAAGTNARQMVLNRDPKLDALQVAADSLPTTIAESDAVHAALTARIAALEGLKVTIGYGTAAVSGSLLAGGTTNVTVTLNRDMGSATYSVGTGLVGGSGLLGSLAIAGVVAQTSRVVTVQLKNTGLVTLANLTGAVVHVVAAREG